MGVIVQPSSGDVPEIPDGLYRATIKKVTPIKLEQPDQFGKTDKLEIGLEFEVDGMNEVLDPRVNLAWSEKATLFMIAVAAGLDVSPHESFDTDLLVGREVNIFTEQEEGKWPRIKSWGRVKGKKPSAPSQSVPAPSGETDISAWWKLTRDRGLDRKEVLARSNEIYGCEPAELAPEDREALLVSFD